MSPASPPAPPATVVDACLYTRLGDPLELADYLPSGWREYIGRPGLLPGGRGMAPLVPAPAWEHPGGGWLAAEPDGGRRAARAVACLEQSLLVGALPNANYGLSLARAINRWTLERGLEGSRQGSGQGGGEGSGEGGLQGLVVAPMQVPEQAAAEVRRAGQDPRIAGVLLAGNGLGKPFGHPVYHPVYAAAAELALPLVLHTGSESPPNTASHPAAGGYPSTYAEYHVLRAQPVMTHLMSLIVQGVLDRHPDLKVLVVGAGFAWLPSWAWRFDSDFRSYAARETPWMKRLPSQQLARQVRVTTYSFAPTPPPDAFQRLLRSSPWLAEVLCFASGSPRWDADEAEKVAAAFPAEWRAAVMHDNAGDLFRWSAGEAG